MRSNLTNQRLFQAGEYNPLVVRVNSGHRSVVKLKPIVAEISSRFDQDDGGFEAARNGKAPARRQAAYLTSCTGCFYDSPELRREER